MASPPDEHAVDTVMLGPVRPYSIAICAAAMLPKILGTKRGLTLLSPLRVISSWVAAMSTTPAIAVPMVIPVLPASEAVSSPLCPSASAAAANAYCENLDESFASFPGI